MAERDPEGWHVPFLRPALIAGALPCALFGLLALAAHFYDARLRGETYAPPTPFPAPGIVTASLPPPRDPEPAPSPARADPAIDAAKRATVRDGIAGWQAEARP